MMYCRTDILKKETVILIKITAKLPYGYTERDNCQTVILLYWQIKRKWGIVNGKWGMVTPVIASFRRKRGNLMNKRCTLGLLRHYVHRNDRLLFLGLPQRFAPRNDSINMTSLVDIYGYLL